MEHTIQEYNAMDFATPPPRPRNAPIFIGSSDIKSLTLSDAVNQLDSFLKEGFDPEQDGIRSRLDTPQGQLLQMPSSWRNYTGTKLLTVTPANASLGSPVIQGVYVLFGGPNQRPLAVFDGRALTNLRTPAVSLLGALKLMEPGPKNLLIFGTGPQAWEHVKAFSSMITINRVGIVGRNAAAARVMAARASAMGLTSKVCSAEEVPEADLIICCTSSAEPLFDGSRVKDTAVTIAIGSHTPDRRELDDALMARASIYVESLRNAQLEAGDIIQALASGAIAGPDSLVNLADLVCGRRHIQTKQPVVFKTTGMPWQDLAIAIAIYESFVRKATTSGPDIPAGMALKSACPE